MINIIKENFVQCSLIQSTLINHKTHTEQSHVPWTMLSTQNTASDGMSTKTTDEHHTQLLTSPNQNLQGTCS